MLLKPNFSSQQKTTNGFTPWQKAYLAGRRYYHRAPMESMSEVEYHASDFYGHDSAFAIAFVTGYRQARRHHTSVEKEAQRHAL